MARFAFLALATAAACTGCTTVSLERHTLEQIHSASVYRAESALHCLAMVSADPGNLPAFSIVADGATRIQDMGTLNSITTWTRAVGGFATESLTATLSRSPQEYWTIDPVVDHTRLEAMRCACRWVLYGPERACCDCPGLLADPEKDLSPTPHFGVEDRLARLPSDWLHVGRLKDVPLGARYKDHCGDAWVWVMPDGMEGLNGFILVLHDIATINIENGATLTPPVIVTLVRTEPLPSLKLTATSLSDESLEKQKKEFPSLEKFRKDFPLIWVKLQGWRVKPPQSQEDFQEDLVKLLKEANLNKDVLKNVQDEVLKLAQQWNPQYSKQLSYTDYRAIKPEYQGLVRQRIEDAVTGASVVQISWDDWMTYTTQYAGVRTNVKPESGITSPGLAVPNRAMSSIGTNLTPPLGYQRSPPPPPGLLGPIPSKE